MTVDEPQVDRLNEAAREAIHFQQTLVQALQEGVSYREEKVGTLLSDHLTFLNAHGSEMSPKSFLENARFLVGDDFHRKMLESMQIGLAYYYLAAVEAFVEG